MSRIRTIKPDFFLDDELAELSPLTRLLFIGLWTLADCQGRMEDRPKRIRAQLHPFDDGDTDAMLQALHDAGFITRYEADGKRYLEIRTFTKHQRLTGKEAEACSEMPAPEPYATANRKPSGNIGETSGKHRGKIFLSPMPRKGKEGKGKGKERKKKRRKRLSHRRHRHRQRHRHHRHQCLSRNRQQHRKRQGNPSPSKPQYLPTGRQPRLPTPCWRSTA